MIGTNVKNTDNAMKASAIINNRKIVSGFI
jgi:hypothetical protein